MSETELNILTLLRNHGYIININGTNVVVEGINVEGLIEFELEVGLSLVDSLIDNLKLKRNEYPEMTGKFPDTTKYHTILQEIFKTELSC